MKGSEVKRIREKFDLTREDLAALLCLSGYRTMMNIETEFRRPAKLAIRLLRYLDALPKARAHALIEELQKYEPK